MGNRYSFEPRDGRNLLRRTRNLLPGVIIGAVLVCLVWAITASVGGRSDTRATLSDGSGHHSVPHQAQSPVHDDSPTSPAQAELQNCHRVYSAQGPVLRDAGVAVAQWQVHIGAMNKLVVGVLTLQQASQFWAQTRIGARAHLRAFDRAFRHLTRHAPSCGQASAMVGAQPIRMKLRRCTLAVAARNDALHAARESLSTWTMHVKHMDMLRSGMLSPSDAEALWIKSWHAGQREVNHYRSAMRKATSYASTCEGT